MLREVVDALLLLGGGAGVAEAFRWVRERRKMGADTAQTLTAATVVLIKPLHDRITELQGEIEECRRSAVIARSEASGAYEMAHEQRTETLRVKRELEAARLELDAAREQLDQCRLHHADPQDDDLRA